MTVHSYQRSLIRQSFANDPKHQQAVARHERDAEAAERLLAKWGVLPTLLPYLRLLGSRK